MWPAPTAASSSGCSPSAATTRPTSGENKESKKRFPPVVQFIGPFELKAKGSNKHEIEAAALRGCGAGDGGSG